jgi:hypothetical protein
MHVPPLVCSSCGREYAAGSFDEQSITRRLRPAEQTAVVVAQIGFS